MHRATSLLYIGKSYILHLHTPLLAVLIHEAREHVIIEAFHAFATNTETIARQRHLAFLHQLLCDAFTYNFRQMSVRKLSASNNSVCIHIKMNRRIGSLNSYILDNRSTIRSLFYIVVFSLNKVNTLA